MAELRAPEQNRLLGQLARMLRTTEGDIAAPEFLPKSLDVMGLVRQLMLPSAETVEKLSYGDPLFRMPTQSNIPITADREYLADVVGMAPMVPAASRATTRLSNEAADQLVRAITGTQATAPQVLEAAGQMLPLSRAYRPTTPLNPDPSVGTRFEREYVGGLADKTPVRMEDLKDSSLMILPWDLSNRNYRITSISDEPLAVPYVTHGGQDYARDIAHIAQGVGGASNLRIAQKIVNRANQARLENLEAGGSGRVVLLPSTMGDYSEFFSVQPTMTMFSFLDATKPTKKAIQEFDKSVRNHIIPGDKEKKPRLKNFKGIMTEEGRMQLLTGEGLDTTPGKARTAVMSKLAYKANQEKFGFNIEDLSGAITDEALAGLPTGYVGNTVLAVGDEGMHLRPSINPTYNTDFTAQYLGSLGQSVPVEALMPKTFDNILQEMAGKTGSQRAMAIGALEKRKKGISELVDQQVIDSYYDYLQQQRNLGLLD
jgi:hypothetical protein